MQDDIAFFQNIAIITDRQSEFDALFCYQNRDIHLPKLRHNLSKLIDHDRRQALSDLIQKNHGRILHQASGNSQHLLFTTGELVAH